jgi:integrase
VANVFSHYDKLNIVPTAEQLRGAFARATEEDNAVVGYVPQELSRVTLQAALTQFTLDKKNRSSWSQGTVVALQSFRRMVGDFMPNTIVNDIDIPWMEKFHEWMVKERNQQGVSVNGNLVKMRWFLRWARKKGYYKGEADRDYRPRVKGADIKSRAIVYLTREELRKLEAYEFEEPHFNVAKDVFLFCCYTGLRSSDIIKLTRADCYNDYITFTTQKTGHTLTIPLNERAKAILDRYAKCKPNRKQKADGITNPALPTTALKTSNKHLHVMLKRVGIDAPTHHVYYIGSERFDETKPKYELVTTHTARHTFIVTAISLGIPIPVIMEWTGHSNFKNMKEELYKRGIEHVDGVLFDLGVSSPQLDDAERGFSFHEDAPLDMRMDQDQKLTAYDVVNNYSKEELARIFFKYGEDKFSNNIAKKIVE